MTLLILIGKVLAFMLLTSLSAFVFLYGKNNTGIKMYYLLTTIVLMLALFI